LATLFISRLRQCFLLRGCRLSALFSNCRLGLLVLLVSLVDYGLCLRGGRLLMLFLRLQCVSAAFLLVLQVGKSGPTFLLLRGLASKLGVEALTAKPQEDDSGCRCLLCMGSALATSGPLVEDALATHSLQAFEGSSFVKKALSGASSLLAGGLLAFVGGALVKKALMLLVAKALKTSHFFSSVSCALVVKALMTSSLLVLRSGMLVTTRGLPLLISSALVEVLLATTRGPPHLVYHPLPILVCVQDAASLMNNWGLRSQQPRGLIVLAIGAIKPIFVMSVG
jgi:hypothetical protein